MGSQYGWEGQHGFAGYYGIAPDATERLMSIHSTKSAANAAMAQSRAEAAKIEDTHEWQFGKLKPLYEVKQYDPADYYSWQDANQMYTRKEMHKMNLAKV